MLLATELGQGAGRDDEVDANAEQDHQQGTPEQQAAQTLVVALARLGPDVGRVNRGVAVHITVPNVVTVRKLASSDSTVE